MIFIQYVSITTQKIVHIVCNSSSLDEVLPLLESSVVSRYKVSCGADTNMYFTRATYGMQDSKKWVENLFPGS